MADSDKNRFDFLADLFVRYRERLLALAARNLNPILSKRFSPEDVVQDTLLAACHRTDYFENNPEIPVYIKLRTLLLQTVADYERKHLQAQKRDAYKERGGEQNSACQSAAEINWNLFADSVTSPLSKMVRSERYALLRSILETLSETDRQILTLRHFDGFSNTECAQVLNIEPKAASIRYVRALQRLKIILAELTEFRHE
ncbi:MAG: sigma-70 family RNA polymerase sigma factor [Planctomycetia bacterium]|nr:sigma-70 family RNA polymerase sigma factor [Planctomycetia bacterium]